jgi:hypothetical protein
MKAVLSRHYRNTSTTGKFILFDGDIKLLDIVSIELPNNGNQKNVSCIPEGVYKVEKTMSPNKGECFSIKDVPGRDNILIHVGNYASSLPHDRSDSKGCILLGMYFEDIDDNGSIDVCESRRAIDKLLNLTDKFTLIII